MIIFLSSSILSGSNESAHIFFDNGSSILDPLIHYVGGSGPGNFTYIQDAIDNSSDYDRVFVYNGIYYENLIINTALTLIGESSESTIVNGGNSGDIPCICVLADNVNIMNFNIVWADWEFHEPGIEIYSQYVEVKDNNISFHDKGIILFPSSKYCLIEGNIFSNVHEGIYFSAPSTQYHQVIDNIFFNNDKGLNIFSTEYSTIKNNTFKNHGFQAINLLNSKYNNICRNTFIDNAIAIIIDEQCNKNKIYNNNFIDNIYHAFDNGENEWDAGWEIGGNYWDDYTGFDENNDTYGDQPHKIKGGVNKDNFPLIQKYQWISNSMDIEIKYIDECFVNESVKFQLIIDGGHKPYSILWNFGDNTTSELQNPNHVYGYPGFFSGLVTVTDEHATSATVPFTIKVFTEDHHPPLICINTPKTGIYINSRLLFSFHSLPLILIVGDIPVDISCSDNETYVVNISISISDYYFNEVNESTLNITIKPLGIGFGLLEIKSFDLAGNIGYYRINFFNI